MIISIIINILNIIIIIVIISIPDLHYQTPIIINYIIFIYNYYYLYPQNNNTYISKIRMLQFSPAWIRLRPRSHRQHSSPDNTLVLCLWPLTPTKLL